MTDPDEPSSESRYRKRTEELRTASLDLQALLEQLVMGCDAVVEKLDAGTTALDVVRSVSDDTGRQRRRDVTAACGRFERALQATRGEGFRILVYDGKTTFTDAARLAGLSTQMVSRLIKSVKPD